MYIIDIYVFYVTRVHSICEVLVHLQMVYIHLWNVFTENECILYQSMR